MDLEVRSVKPSVYIRRKSRSPCIPTAIVRSKRETHDSVPGSSSRIGVPLLELGLEEVFVEVVNDMMRADGRLKRISICGSGLLEGCRVAGRLNERRGVGVEGTEAIMNW